MVDSLHSHPSDPRRNETKRAVIQDYCAVCPGFVWYPCIVINASVQYNGGFLPDILLLTQAPTIFVWFEGNIILLPPS